MRNLRVFVTVGTTRFPTLVRFFDRPSSRCDVLIQHADSASRLSHARGFAYSASVTKHYSWADVVVTHAGAGSVYELLENQRKIVVVPNLDRLDKHQLDLAKYIATRRYALVVNELHSFASIDMLIDAAMSFEATPYIATRFFKAPFVLSLLDETFKDS